MSKYNHYAIELNKAFRSAATATTEALEALADAESKRTTRYYGEARYQEARDNLARIQRETWPEFVKARDRLTRDLEAEVAEDRVLDPSAVDFNALALLDSGIATATDLEAMAAMYEANPTMSRLIGQKAGTMAAKEQDTVTRQRLTQISYNATSRPAVLRSWDSLTGASRHYSEEIDANTTPEMISKLAANWERNDVQEVIANF